MLSKAKCVLILLTNICAKVLQHMHVSDTKVSSSIFSPFLLTGIWMDGWLAGWLDGWMDGWDGWAGGRKDG